MKKPIYKVIITNLVTDKSPEMVQRMIEQGLQPIRQLGTKPQVHIEEVTR